MCSRLHNEFISSLHVKNSYSSGMKYKIEVLYVSISHVILSLHYKTDGYFVLFVQIHLFFILLYRLRFYILHGVHHVSPACFCSSDHPRFSCMLGKGGMRRGVFTVLASAPYTAQARLWQHSTQGAFYSTLTYLLLNIAQHPLKYFYLYCIQRPETWKTTQKIIGLIWLWPTYDTSVAQAGTNAVVAFPRWMESPQ